MKLDGANLELVEIEGELALLVRLGRGQGEPISVLEAARRKYVMKPPKEDFVPAFLAAMTVNQPGARCRAVALFDAYDAWCQRAGVVGLSRRWFGAAMKARGFRKIHSNGIWWLDLGLIEMRQGVMH